MLFNAKMLIVGETRLRDTLELLIIFVTFFKPETTLNIWTNNFKQKLVKPIFESKYA